ncbi:MAG: acyl-CoA thioester hydrolase/BAAT C-terminal domain-containing protein, partial [Thermomicrobiales bacterium]
AEGAVASPLAITAEIDRDEVARVDVERPLLTPAITHTPVREQGLYGEFFLPATDDSAPAVLVLGGSNGGLGPHLEREAALLATHGFAALALAYFRAGLSGLLPSELVNIPLEYFAKAIDWLGQQLGVRGDRLGVVGHSRGGELALLLGATYPAFEAVVSYVGSGLIYSALNGVDPAWTYNGQPLPHFWNPENWSDSAIPVERINGPVLLISAENDLVWQSAILSQFAEDRLLRMNHSYAVEHRRYQDAGHFILPPYQPATQGLDFSGGTAHGNATAMADSWPRVLRLLDERLRR